MQLYKTRASKFEPSVQFVYGRLKDRPDLNGVLQTTRFLLVTNTMEDYLIRDSIHFFESREFFTNECGALEIEFAVERELPIKEIKE